MQFQSRQLATSSALALFDPSLVTACHVYLFMSLENTRTWTWNDSCGINWFMPHTMTLFGLTETERCIVVADSQVESFIKSHSTCLQHNKTAISPPAPPSPTAAWKKIAVDIAGPFHGAALNCHFHWLLQLVARDSLDNSNVASAIVMKFLTSVFSRKVFPLNWSLITAQSWFQLSLSHFLLTETSNSVADKSIIHKHMYKWKCLTEWLLSDS